MALLKKKTAANKPIEKVEKPVIKLMLELKGMKTLNTPQAKILIESILKELI